MFGQYYGLPDIRLSLLVPYSVVSLPSDPFSFPLMSQVLSVTLRPGSDFDSNLRELYDGYYHYHRPATGEPRRMGRVDTTINSVLESRGSGRKILSETLRPHLRMTVKRKRSTKGPSESGIAHDLSLTIRSPPSCWTREGEDSRNGVVVGTASSLVTNVTKRMSGDSVGHKEGTF